MLRWRRCAMVLCLLVASAAMAQNGAALTLMSHDALELVKVLTAQERAWNEGNLQGFLTGYKHAPDTTFVSGAIQHGFDEMAAHYKASYPNKEAMGTLSFSDLEPRLLDDRFAIVTGKYSLERSRKAGGNAGGLFSLVFEKTETGWKIVLDHTT